MGGLMPSSVLTLVVLPYLNLGVEGVANWLKRLSSRRLASRPKSNTPPKDQPPGPRGKNFGKQIVKLAEE
jgi:hypothetical protein